AVDQHHVCEEQAVVTEHQGQRDQCGSPQEHDHDLRRLRDLAADGLLRLCPFRETGVHPLGLDNVCWCAHALAPEGVPRMPWGRTSSTTMIRRNPAPSPRVVEMYVDASTLVTPTSRLPRTAPGMLPKPPRAIPTKAMFAARAPMSAETRYTGAASRPATAPRTAATAHVIRKTRLVLMPT